MNNNTLSEIPLRIIQPRSAVLQVQKVSHGWVRPADCPQIQGDPNRPRIRRRVRAGLSIE